MKLKAPPIRFWIGFMIFMTTFTNYMMRANLSVSIVIMIKEAKGNDTVKIPCETKHPVNTSNAPAKKKYEPTYEWNAHEKNLIIAAYFHGYMITSLPAGTIAELIGPFHVIFWSSVVSAALTGLTPLSAKGGVAGIYVCRFIIGLLGGLVYPAINVLIAQWAPPKEKGKFLAALMGNTLGTVVTWSLVGFISEAMTSWQWGFYILVIVMAVYCLVFFFLVADTPDKHRCISEDEKAYIQEAQQGALSKNKKKALPPYWQIMKSLPFWAMTVCQFGNLWGLNLILVYAPSFMAKYLGFNIRSSGFLSSLPYLARLIFSQMFGILGDWMRKKEFMSITKLRKFFIIFSHLIPAVTLFLILVVKCSHIGVITLLVLNQAFNGAVVVGHLINPQDLAPNFAGTIYGIMNFVAGTTGFIVPPIIGALEHSKGIELETSQIIYAIGGAVFAGSGLFFILFGSGNLQSWNWGKEGIPPEEPKDN